MPDDDLHVREIIRIRLYGLEPVQRIAAARLDACASAYGLCE